MDVFISHASEDLEIAESIQKILLEAGLTSWLDRSELAIGALLRDELMSALRGSRVTVLLWSEAASKSRYVASELLSTYHMNHSIVAVRLEETLLPQFLQKSVYLNVYRSGKQVLQDLPRAVREAPDTANKLLPFMAGTSLEQNVAIHTIAALQQKELAFLPGDLSEAQKVHAEVDVMVREAEEKWKYHSMILALSGFHLKNAYMLRHWAENDAGRTPKDALLLQAEAKFFETLFVNPEDPSGLNGLGSILILERELNAAEFFLLRAIEFAERAGGVYPEAEQDLALVRSYLRDR